MNPPIEWPIVMMFPGAYPSDSSQVKAASASSS